VAKTPKKKKTTDAAAFLLIILIATSGIYFFEHLRVEDEMSVQEDEHNERMVSDISQALLSTTLPSVEYTDTEGTSKTYIGQTILNLVAEELALKLSFPGSLNTSSLEVFEARLQEVMKGITPPDIIMELRAGIGNEEHISLSDGSDMGSYDPLGEWSSDLPIPDSSRTGFITIEFFQID